VITKIDHIFKQVRKYKLEFADMPSVERLFLLQGQSIFLLM